MPQHLGGLPVVIKPASAKKRARPSTAPAGRTNGKKLSKYATSTSKGENKVEARVEWDRSTNEWVISRPRDSDAWYKDWVKPDWHMEKKRALHDAVHREGLESHELDSDFSDFIHDKVSTRRAKVFCLLKYCCGYHLLTIDCGDYYILFPLLFPSPHTRKPTIYFEQISPAPLIIKKVRFGVIWPKSQPYTSPIY